jgi:hypothetical protein
MGRLLWLFDAAAPNRPKQEAAQERCSYAALAPSPGEKAPGSRNLVYHTANTVGDLLDLQVLGRGLTAIGNLFVLVILPR